MDAGAEQVSRYDVVVVGGGAAGLSAALTLAQARRSVLVIDAGDPRNAPAAAVRGFLTRDGIAPGELVELGRAEVRRFGGEIVSGTVESAARDGDHFTVTPDTGDAVSARRLLIATGLADELPDVPGVRERWGRDVLHCPYCHGWDVRDQPIGVLASGPAAVHQALLFSQWSPDVALFVHTAPEPNDVDAARLRARGVTVVHGEVAAVEVSDDRISGVRLRDGHVVPRRAVVVGPRMIARAAFLLSLGLKAVEHPMGIGEFIESDPTGLTSTPGVYVAGNVTNPQLQVLGAAAAGTAAAAALNLELINVDITATSTP